MSVIRSYFFSFLAIDNDIMRKMCTLITSKATDIDENTAICVQAQTANIFARLFTFETGRLPLETEMFHRSCDVSH